MATNIKTPEKDLADAINRLEGMEKRMRDVERLAPPQQFDGNGSNKAFALPRGQTPYLVALNGVIQIEGSGDDFTTSTAFDVTTVTFAVAPANGAAVTIYPKARGI